MQKAQKKQVNSLCEEDCGISAERYDDLCPVKSFERYISKFNAKVDYFFQRPKKEAPKDVRGMMPNLLALIP